MAYVYNGDIFFSSKLKLNFLSYHNVKWFFSAFLMFLIDIFSADTYPDKMKVLCVLLSVLATGKCHFNN